MGRSNKSAFYEPYAGFSKLLRTWLVTYGIGAIILVSSQKLISDALQTNAVVAEKIINLLIIGLVVQVFAAFLYKYSMLYLYHGEDNENLKSTKRYKIADFLSECVLLEMVFDILSIIVFAKATYLIAVLALKI